MVLEKIEHENDIKRINKNELPILAEEIRSFLIDKISKTGGHLASNLGVVELTMALHLAFDLPEDKIIWDVGHQSYTHKLLTGRKAGFDELRKYGGMSGFPKRHESDCDCFDTGHSSTSISAGLGYAMAREITGEKYKVISVIGDGALTGGMAYEALNNASKLKSNLIIVLNDNKMSISENVGGVSRYLSGLRTAESYQGLKNGITNSLNSIPKYGERIVEKIRKTKNGIKQLVIPGMLFENMGILYLGPVDGHNIPAMVKLFKEASKVEGPVLVHVITEKGKGYLPAERHPARFHGTEAFDVGIAEEHAVTFAAGLAAAGLKPIVAVYSSFLQRAYDQILHDVCIQELHVVFAIDRAGLVGSDGETHQGIFDLSYLSCLPNMTILAPKNKWELSDMIKYAVDFSGPIAVRYPRGEAFDELKEYRAPLEYGKAEVLYEESEILLLAVGSMVKTALTVRERLKEKGYSCSLVNARFVKPFDEELLLKLQKNHKLLVTLEENVQSGGFGEHVLEFMNTNGDGSMEVLNIAIPDVYVEHGNVELLRKETGIDADGIIGKIIDRKAQ